MPRVTPFNEPNESDWVKLSENNTAIHANHICLRNGIAHKFNINATGKRWRSESRRHFPKILLKVNWIRWPLWFSCTSISQIWRRKWRFRWGCVFHSTKNGEVDGASRRHGNGVILLWGHRMQLISSLWIYCYFGTVNVLTHISSPYQIQINCQRIIISTVALCRTHSHLHIHNSPTQSNKINCTRCHMNYGLSSNNSAKWVTHTHRPFNICTFFPFHGINAENGIVNGLRTIYNIVA